MNEVIKPVINYNDLSKNDLVSRIRIERKNATENFGKECNDDVVLINDVHGDDVKGMRSYANEDLPKAKKALTVTAAFLVGVCAIGLLSASDLSKADYFNTSRTEKRVCTLAALATGAIGIPIGVALKNDIIKDKKILDTLDKWGTYLNEQKFTINTERT